jgi:THO complex subunit 4
MSFYDRRGGERVNGRIRGSGGRGGHVMRGRSGLPPRGPLGVNSRPSARTIAKARPKLSLCFCSWSDS